jgi:hypothetical protein
MAIVPDQTEQNESEGDIGESLPYAARAAICFLQVDADGDDVALYDKICTVLRADSRIESLTAPAQDEHSFERPWFATFDTEDPETEALDPATHTHAFRFTDPMTFEIHAPRRVQPHFEDFDNIPAGRYWAAWDGIALVVLWKLEDFEESGSTLVDLSVDDMLDGLTPSGGLIVQKVIEDAAKKCGYSIVLTPCSPNCSYTFAHMGLSVNPISFDDDIEFNEDVSEAFARVSLPVLENSPIEVVGELHHRLAFIIRIFAEMRSEGRTAVGAGSSTRRDLRKLLNLNYERARIGVEPFRNTLRKRWAIRGWRRNSRLLIARMWLTLATLDRARQDWSKLRYLYDAAAGDDNIGVVFSSEYGHEIHGTSEIDVSEARSVLERITNTLDSRALILSTGVGAVVGAIIGAIVGHLT